MKPHLALVLLFCLSIGCSRTPVSPAPVGRRQGQAVCRRARRQIHAEAGERKENDVPVKDIAKPRDNPEIVPQPRTRHHSRRRPLGGSGAEAPDPATSDRRGDARHPRQAAVWLTPSDKARKPVIPVQPSTDAEPDEYRPHILLRTKGNTLELRTIEDRPRTFRRPAPPASARPSNAVKDSRCRCPLRD